MRCWGKAVNEADVVPGGSRVWSRPAEVPGEPHTPFRASSGRMRKRKQIHLNHTFSLPSISKTQSLQYINEKISVFGAGPSNYDLYLTLKSTSQFMLAIFREPSSPPGAQGDHTRQWCPRLRGWRMKWRQRWLMAFRGKW